jgi:hypothetical protein
MLSPALLLVISRYQILVVALGGLATLALWPEATLGLVGGGGVMAGNFYLMHRALARITDNTTSRRAKLVYGFFLIGKFFLVMGALALLVLVLKLHPMGIALGMMSLFVGIGLGIAHRTLQGV